MRRRMRAALAAVLGLLILLSTAASATAVGERTPVPEKEAQRIATSECGGFQLDLGLVTSAIPGSALTNFAAGSLCHTGVKESLIQGDREAGAEAVCERTTTAALGIFKNRVPAASLDQFNADCGKAFGPVLSRAWSVVQPVAAATGKAVEQATCVMSTGGVPCIMKQVTTWMTNESGQFSLAVSEALTAPSASTEILRTFQTPTVKRTGQQSAFAEVYQVVGGVALSVVLIAVLLSLVNALVQRSGRPLGEAFGGVVSWGLFWVAGLSVAAMVLSAFDSLAVFLVGVNPGGKSEVDKALDSVFMVLVAAANPVTGGLLAFIALLLYIVALVGMVLQIVLRDVSIILVAVMLPVLLALRAGPGVSRKLLLRSVGTFLMLAMAKPLLILVLRLSSALTLTPGTGVRGMFFGLAILLIAAVAPGVAYKIMGVMTNSAAGQSTGAGAAGVADQTMHSAQSLKNMVGGGSPKLGSSAAGGKAAGAGASKLGAAAGPVGMAATAAIMAGSAMKSGAQALASQVGTGGGALGDAETPRVPTAPVSRGGGGSGPARGGSSPGGGGSRTPPVPKGSSATKAGQGSGGRGTPSQAGPQRQPQASPAASSGGGEVSAPNSLPESRGGGAEPGLGTGGPAPRERPPSTPASRAAVRERKAEVRQERVDHKRARISQRQSEGRTRR